VNFIHLPWTVNVLILGKGITTVIRRIISKLTSQVNINRQQHVSALHTSETFCELLAEIAEDTGSLLLFHRQLYS
jgi:hypothetical protein